MTSSPTAVFILMIVMKGSAGTPIFCGWVYLLVFLVLGRVTWTYLLTHKEVWDRTDSFRAEESTRCLGPGFGCRGLPPGLGNARCTCFEDRVARPSSHIGGEGLCLYWGAKAGMGL